MRAVIAVFFIALAVSAFSIPPIRRVAVALGFVDAPAQRKLHSTPMPLMGGLAIFGGAIVAVLVVYRGRPPDQVLGILLALTVVALVGLWDDRNGLPAWAKLGGQLIGGAILIWFDVRVQLPVPDALNYALTLFWLAGISNAINFLDNMDGLSAGVSAVAAAFMLLLGALNEQFLVAALAAAVLGACLGFLRYNFKPAQIFMGDVGALFLGFVLAILGLQLRFPENANIVTWMVPVFILGLPIFDTSLVVISRIRRGVSPNTAGKDHTSHRLVKMGYSQREAVLILYLFTGAFGMVGVFLTKATVLEAYLMAGISALVALYAISRLERVYRGE
ncbi:MAG: undecaprenyl/decaprenyl-phosphate alpha-N-acetylglucosaminyl 1-phosphate transferase [Ardenticatenaceae bacterium]|nr:undecaprenyl/decaprenyl-phosphate alpha-N-acetylglucosaminyl 1-phosphate transferase [Anaerolineales bacterium]MCB8920487.1 undecaprenyl/decaprenyl-phosphate alpha-N-acetylglucosaminyl 1-phosphate transferase [Ardenticatenaceae bacterium]MCB8989441.1 undecaprenyl/decaprenyl-phosphate alpha-N-acetylglucosaminyl 1-phosphate transferase [Ardenticatenaceae bacterium]MCB9005021.1 undecaprenyl/decaprenyl-phosphate alpha-N-acetylglucosaminyl 1-phosphate transferase [Ardenticatenaceae bacterium]